MHTKSPKAEDILHGAFQKADLTKSMLRDICLLITVVRNDEGEELGTKVEWAYTNDVTKEMVMKCTLITVPDYTVLPPVKLPIYLDGAVHELNGVRTKDERIRKRLKLGGWEPKCFDYASPISQKRVFEIVNEIKEALASV
jgi:hypothetical protein